MSVAETLNFQTETEELLHLMIHSLSIPGKTFSFESRFRTRRMHSIVPDLSRSQGWKSWTPDRMGHRLTISDRGSA